MSRKGFLLTFISSILICSSVYAKEKSGYYYKVHKGDTLYSIARRFTVNPNKLADYNKLSFNKNLRVGQKIYIYSRNKPKNKKIVKRINRKSTKKIARKNTIKQMGRFTAHWPTILHTNVNKPEHSWQKGLYINGKFGMPIKAANSGKVVYSGDGLRGYGRLIILKHSDSYITAYANNSKIYVQEGDFVKNGQKIAEMGYIRNKKPGLYFEVRHKGEPVDPLKFLR